MANDLNQYTCIGRLGRDPELKKFQNGDAYVSISLAVGEQWKDKASGEKKEKTTWVPFVFYGKLAEVIAQYCVKGSQMCATGKFQIRKWTDKDGVERQVGEFIGLNMHMLGGKSDGAKSGGNTAAQRTPPARSNDLDDDIPF